MLLSDSESVRHRIAFIQPDLWVGGGTTFVLNLAGELVHRCTPTQVFSLGEVNSLASDFDRMQIPVSCEPSKGRIFEDRIEGVLRKLKQFEPTVAVACFGMTPCEVLRYLPKEVLRIGVVHTAFPAVLDEARRYAAEVDFLVAISEEVQLALQTALVGHSVPVHCIELGVPIPAKIERPVSNDPLRLLYLGRLEELAKRVRLFPAILGMLKASKIPFVWTIAGDGPERSYLEQQMVEENNNQRVKFKGIVPYSDVSKLLQKHDILLLTSDSESFSLCLHEAMASGMVPVASAISGPVGKAVTPQTGIPVSPENVAGYADAILWLHTHREEMQKMSVASRERMAQTSSVALMTDRWMGLIGNRAPMPPTWPSRWRIRPPLTTQAPARFSPPMRILRRIAARLMRKRQ